MTRHWLADWLKHRRERAEIDSLPGDELGRIAHDLGVSAFDLELMVEKGRDPGQLEDLLDAVGFEQAALARTEPAMLRDMQRLCALCETADECARELECGTAVHNYHRFCLNAPTIDALKAERKL